jgi:hypothetical protein
VLAASGSLDDAALLLGALIAEAFGPLTAHVTAQVHTFGPCREEIRSAVRPDALADLEARGATMDGRAVVAFALEALAS